MVELIEELRQLYFHAYDDQMLGLTDGEEKRLEELNKQILDDYEKARLCDGLTKILMNHCGEDGDNEGAVDTLNRISEKVKKFDIITTEGFSTDTVREEIKIHKQNQKLREQIVDLADIWDGKESQRYGSILQTILDELNIKDIPEFYKKENIDKFLKELEDNKK